MGEIYGNVYIVAATQPHRFEADMGADPRHSWSAQGVVRRWCVTGATVLLPSLFSRVATKLCVILSDLVWASLAGTCRCIAWKDHWNHDLDLFAVRSAKK